MPSHRELAMQLEEQGCEVRMDHEDNEHSEVLFNGAYVGDIQGDSDARIEVCIIVFGRVLAKANKTDPEFQSFLVRFRVGNDIEYLPRLDSGWMTMPKEWQKDVVWD